MLLLFHLLLFCFRCLVLPISLVIFLWKRKWLRSKPFTRPLIQRYVVVVVVVVLFLAFFDQYCVADCIVSFLCVLLLLFGATSVL
jgi:hypothetical protein